MSTGRRGFVALMSAVAAAAALLAGAAGADEPAAKADAAPQLYLDVTCPSDEVKAAVAVHREELRACYERRAAKAPGLSSTSVLEWTVRPDGTITSPAASAMAAEYEDPELRDCLVARIRSWAFPAPDEPVEVTMVVGFARTGGVGIRGGSIVFGQGGGGQKKEATAVGAIDKDALRKVIQAHQASILKCYEGRLAQDRTLAGKVVLRWLVQADGAATDVEVGEGTTLEDRALHECMKASVARWRFPRPRNGGVAIITYPWLLRPQPAP